MNPLLRTCRSFAPLTALHRKDERLRGRLSTACAAFVLLVASSASAAPVFEVGTIVKPGFFSGSVRQFYTHSLGTTPKAIIMWTAKEPPAAAGDGLTFSIGISDGTNEGSASTFHTSSASPRRRLANSLLNYLVADDDRAVLGTIFSWSDTHFEISFAAADGAPITDSDTAVLHYILIGGDTVNAKVVEWTDPAATGLHTVSGVGFEPDGVLLVHAGRSDSTTGRRAHLASALGAMDADGEQWMNIMRTPSSVGTSEESVRRQRSDAVLLSFNNAISPVTIVSQAAYSSMTSDGFTLDYALTDQGKVRFGLALSGLSFDVGTFAKTTAAGPALQSVTGVGFQPDVVLFSTVQANSTTQTIAGGRWGIGAANSTNEGTSAQINPGSATPPDYHAIDKTDKVLVKVDNDTRTIDAEADLASMDTDGFTLNWTTNDSEPTEVVFVAFAAPAVCGNAELEGDESCDDGNTSAGDCCDASCEYESSGAPCGDADSTCLEQDTCDGGGSCIDNGLKTSCLSAPACPGTAVAAASNFARRSSVFATASPGPGLAFIDGGCSGLYPLGAASGCAAALGTPSSGMGSARFEALWPSTAARTADSSGGCIIQCPGGSCRVRNNGLPVELLGLSVE